MNIHTVTERAKPPESHAPLSTPLLSSCTPWPLFSPHLGEVARAFLVGVTELCGAAFLAEESILFRSLAPVAVIVSAITKYMSPKSNPV